MTIIEKLVFHFLHQVSVLLFPVSVACKTLRFCDVPLYGCVAIETFYILKKKKGILKSYSWPLGVIMGNLGVEFGGIWGQLVVGTVLWLYWEEQASSYTFAFGNRNSKSYSSTPRASE